MCAVPFPALLEGLGGRERAEKFEKFRFSFAFFGCFRAFWGPKVFFQHILGQNASFDPFSSILRTSAVLGRKATFNTGQRITGFLSKWAKE